MKTIEFKEDEIIVDGIKYTKDYETKQEPEFKVGQWAKYLTADNPANIFYITKFDGNKVFGITNPDGREMFRCYVIDLFSVTPAEIESHLKKICDEKGFKTGVRYISTNGFTFVAKHDPEFMMRGKDDPVLYCGNNLGWIYENGKFAEIIPDKKKKPETREEFLIFLDDYCESDDKSHQTFLDQYDI